MTLSPRVMGAAMFVWCMATATHGAAQEVFDTVGAIAAVQRLYRALDARDTARLRTLVRSDALIIGPNARGELRALPVQAAVSTLNRGTERETTQLRPTQLTIRADFAEVWLDYNVAVRGRSARCGVASVDLQGRKDAWRGVVVMFTERTAGCPLPRLTEAPAPRGRFDTTVAAHAIAERARDAERVFFVQWKRAWLASEIARDSLLLRDQARPISLPLPPRRVKAAHCHGPASDVLSASELTASVGFQGRRPQGRFSACAMWYAGDGPPPFDEGAARDTTLPVLLRADIDRARDHVLALLDSANAANPADPFAVGQLVRLLLDRGQFVAARDVARKCRSERWWCLALEGLAVHAAGDARRADSVFALVAPALSPAGRCAWIDAGELLEPDGRAAYAALPCERKQMVTRNLWWVADPLLFVPWNERRAEHFARKVQVTLRRSLDFDERHQLEAWNGGDAILELFMRYGWPSVAGWAGLFEDRDHTMWLGQRDVAPYVSFEYARGRVHAVPSWRAIERPFASRATDWTLNEPAGDKAWWPFEHFASAVPLVQLRDYQSALLRRDDSLLFAVAVDLEPAVVGHRLHEQVADVHLVVSDAPDSARVVASRNATAGAPAALRALVPARPMLAGVEFAAGGALSLAPRVRFGVDNPPTTLAAFQRDSIAVSEPVLLVTSNANAPLPNAADSALALMRGSTRLRNEQFVGVYWETYGIGAGDSVEVAVWIERYSKQGAFRRLGIALDLARDLNTRTSTRWIDANAGRAGAVQSGSVTIIGRSLRLDVSELPKGDYWLDVEVRRPGGAPVRGRRSFSVE